MNHAEIRSLLAGHLTDIVANQGVLPVALRPYQVETIESAARWLSDSNGTRRAYVSEATGLGKTIEFATMIRAASGLRSLVVVPTKTLLVQTARVIARFTGGMLGHLSSLANITDSDGETVAVRGMDHSAIVLTTDASFNKLAHQIKQSFDPHLILRDECHWGYIDSAISALNQFDESVIIGFSATPDYLTNKAKGGYLPVTLENGQILYGPRDRFAETHFQTCLARHPLRWGIENGWLAPLAWGMIEFDVSLKGIPIVNGPDGPDYEQGKLQQVMRKHWSVMCETIRRLYERDEYSLNERQVYAVCPNVDEAEELAQAIGSLGIPAACVTGSTPDAERDILLQAHKDKEIRFLSSVMVLREGWDSVAEVCMMLRPTASRVLYEQSIGRCERLPEDGSHKVALVLDAHFQRATFSPLSAPTLFGKPGEEIPVGGMLIGGGDGGVRGGDGVESPYLPKDAAPRIVVIEMYGDLASEKDVLYASHDGTAQSEGKIWAPMKRLSSILGFSNKAIISRVQGLPTKKGHLHHNLMICDFYVVEDVRERCRDLSEELPILDLHGFVVYNDEEWGAINAIAARYHISSSRVIERRDSCRAITVRDRSKRQSIAVSVSDFTRIAVELVDDTIPRANKNGCCVVNGVRYAPMFLLTQELGVRPTTIINRMTPEVRSIRAKDRRGHVVDFFVVDDVRLVLKDLLAVKHVLDDEQSIIIRNEVWMSAHGLTKKLNFAKSSLKRYLVNAPQEQARLSNGIVTVYNLEEVRKNIFGDAEDVPTNQGSGFIFWRNEYWGHASAIGKLVGCATQKVQLQINRSTKCRSCRARNKIGQLTDYYSVKDFIEIAPNLVKDSRQTLLDRVVSLADS
ncbi:MAG: DEAD/DEAH box helicase family protein [Patescibacteria group bacterium]|jgi:hypothetical protein